MNVCQHNQCIIGSPIIPLRLQFKCTTSLNSCGLCGCIPNIRGVAQPDRYECVCDYGLDLIREGQFRCEKNCSKARDPYATEINPLNLLQCLCVTDFVYNTTIYKCVRNCTK